MSRTTSTQCVLMALREQPLSSGRPSAWGISLQSSQRGSGPDSALLLVQVQPETVALLW